MAKLYALYLTMAESGVDVTKLANGMATEAEAPVSPAALWVSESHDLGSRPVKRESISPWVDWIDVSSVIGQVACLDEEFGPETRNF